MSLATDLSDGIGGLKFVATAPPGVGRLVRIPFYLETATVSFQAIAPGANAGGASTTSPVISAISEAAGAQSDTATMRTPQISWATLRIVGFECAINSAEVPLAVTPEVLFSDLKIGGGANLFVHEDFASSRIYLSGQDSFSGLRDYPLLKSPNVAEVQVSLFSVGAALNNPAAAATDTASGVLFTCNLVCEILQDDNYGSHIPGPYARKGAMVRKGGSFV